MVRFHNISKRDWDKRTWAFPRIHNFEFGFGLSAESSTQASTIQPYLISDDASVDFDTIYTNPEHASFAIHSGPNVIKGSYVPKMLIDYVMYIPPSDTEITHLAVDTMRINTAMLNRLDAIDEKTGNDTETILELTHETTDLQCYPLWNGTKLFESGGTYDLDSEVPGLTTDQQPEGVAFDKEMFFDAMHYYTNRDMLKTITQNMRSYTLSEPIVPHGSSIIRYRRTIDVPSICKAQNDYTFLGDLFHVPQVGSRSQYHLASETTGIEHLTVKGFCRFYEYNPDFNMERA